MLPSSFRLLCCVLLLSLAAFASTSAQDATSPTPAQQAGAAAEKPGVNTSAPGDKVTGEIIQRAGKDVAPPHVVYSPDPPYSDAARHAGFQAMVYLSLVVDIDGSPKRVRVQQGAGMGLDEASIETVRTWRFQPGTRNGEPVAIPIVVEVHFRMEGHEKDAPLYSPPEANRKPPQFPGVDITAYPLLIHIDGATGMPDGKSYRIVAEATLEDTVGERSFSMTCSGGKDVCPFLTKGMYPARWKTENRQLEIMGKEIKTNSWRKADYIMQTHDVAPQATP